MIPRSRATRAIGLPVSRTMRTAPSRNSRSNRRLGSATNRPGRCRPVPRLGPLPQPDHPRSYGNTLDRLAEQLGVGRALREVIDRRRTRPGPRPVMGKRRGIDLEPASRRDRLIPRLVRPQRLPCTSASGRGGDDEVGSRGVSTTSPLWTSRWRRCGRRCWMRGLQNGAVQVVNRTTRAHAGAGCGADVNAQVDVDAEDTAVVRSKNTGPPANVGTTDGPTPAGNLRQVASEAPARANRAAHTV